MLDRHIVVSHGLCLVLRPVQGVIEGLADVALPGAGHLGELAQQLFVALLEILRLDLHPLQQLDEQAVILAEQCLDQMFLIDLLVAVLPCYLFRILQSLHGFLCESADIHKTIPPFPEFPDCSGLPLPAEGNGCQMRNGHSSDTPPF